MRSRFQRRRLHAAIAAALSATAIAALPGTADAASVGYASGTITYTAAAGEANHVSVAVWGFGLKISESGTKGTPAVPVTLSATYGCYPLSSTSVMCPIYAAKLNADLGDGDDVFASSAALPVSVKGGTGNDSLTGGIGIDTLDGGANDDTIDARDSVADSIVCGTGSDGGSADALDTTSADCESVQRPSAAPTETIVPPVVDPPVDPSPLPGTTDPGTTDPDPGNGGDHSGTSDNDNSATPANAVAASIPAQAVGVTASGVARVRVDCPADSGGCSGTVALVLPAAASVKSHARVMAKRAAAPLALGHAKFKAKAGTSPVVPVRLSKRGRQRILRSSRGRRARIVVTTLLADGTTTTASQDVTIKRGHQAAKSRRSGRR